MSKIDNYSLLKIVFNTAEQYWLTELMATRNVDVNKFQNCLPRNKSKRTFAHKVEEKLPT